MTPSALSLLLHVTAAPTCEPTDLACTARDSALEARRATDPLDRAVAHVTAARANLGLYRETGDLDRLCDARNHLDHVPRARASELGDLPRETRQEVAGELSRRRHVCSPRPRRSQAVAPVAPVASSTAPDPRPTAPSEVAASDLLDVAVSRLPALGPPASATNSPGQATIAVHVQGPIPAPVLRGADAASRQQLPGRHLLIAGGVVLASGALAGGLTAVAAIRLDDVQQKHNILAAEASDKGYTAPHVDAQRQALAADAQHWRSVVIGTAVATGVATATAVALLTAGAVKARRASSRIAVSPLLPGVLLTARF
jgi:hypothetical protein